MTACWKSSPFQNHIIDLPCVRIHVILGTNNQPAHIKQTMNRYDEITIKLNSLYYQVTDTEAVEPDDQRRGRLMAMYLSMVAVILVHVTVSNLAYLLFKSADEYNIYVMQDTIGLIILYAFWNLNRRGYTKLTAHACINLTILGAILLYSPKDLELTMVILALPVITSSFVIHPAASFFYALLVMIGYTYSNYYYGSFASYNFTGVLALFAIAIFTFFTAWQLNHTLHKNQFLLKDLQSSYETSLDSWSRALDLRDKETEGHTQRVTKLTCKIARAMKLSEEDLLHIRRGSLLHDIGKLGVPDEILHKHGPLTNEEWKIMRQHPQFAYNLLYPIEYLRPAMDIPYSHHERWDGAGYPQGLKGGEIPLYARIFAIADVYDALTSDRPYRTAWPKERALEYIQQGCGTHFDPEVVKIFMQEIQK